LEKNDRLRRSRTLSDHEKAAKVAAAAAVAKESNEELLRCMSLSSEAADSNEHFEQELACYKKTDSLDNTAHLIEPKEKTEIDIPDPPNVHRAYIILAKVKSNKACTSVMLLSTLLSLALFVSLLVVIFTRTDQSKATITFQIGGEGMTPSFEVKELYRPKSDECLSAFSLPNLPIPLAAHVAMEVEDLGLLVCGGLSDRAAAQNGKKCFLFTEDKGWTDFPHELQIGRVNSYIKKEANKVYIIGGSSSDVSKPCLKSQEVLDLFNLSSGWEKVYIAESKCWDDNDVVVEIACK